MGDVSVIARRLKDGHVQHGWSGNGGYFSMVGARLLEWYKEPESVEYLFSLGQLRLIGVPCSEHGIFPWFYSHELTGRPHYLGGCEDDVFSKIEFIDYVYFYDMDNKWYYDIPNRFTIKTPLELIANNIDDSGNEFDYINYIEKEILKYMLTDYLQKDIEFQKMIQENCYDTLLLLEKYENEEDTLYKFCENYKYIYEYFDDWVVVETDDEYTKITGFKMKTKTEKHIETSEW